MPRVKPEIMVWARETAGLSQETAANKLGYRDSSRSAAAEKLDAIENGCKEPSRRQLVKMAETYRRPLLTFYLSRPPERESRGADFRTVSQDRQVSHEALLDALVRDIKARQSMVRSILEDEDEAEPLHFVGSHSIGDGRAALLATMQALLDRDSAEYRAQPNASAAFAYLRERAEKSSIFVLLKGDLGNYHTALDTGTFRGFSVADDVAPFVVINDNDARPAWSFTLLHEIVHLLLGQTGISGHYSDNQLERFCNDVAGEFLLPASELSQLALNDGDDLSTRSETISYFAEKAKVSRTMVAYKAYRSGLMTQQDFNRLSALYGNEWRSQSAGAIASRQKGGPSFYTVRRHRLGDRIVSLMRRMVVADAVSTSKAARILGVKSRQVEPLIYTGSSY